jgi:curli biogenesis system outer membrane secretion channel CsgG
MKKRELRVVRSKTREVVSRVDVHGKSDRMVERVMSGMLRQMNTDEFHVEDSKDDESLR